MNTTPLLGMPRLDAAADPDIVAALRPVIVGEHAQLHAAAATAAAAVDDLPVGSGTFHERAHAGARQLRALFGALGRTPQEVFADPELAGAAIDAAAVAAVPAMLAFTGTVDLTVGAIVRLGNGSPYQQRLLAALNAGAALGVRVHTELGGTNRTDVRTLAIRDRGRGGFVLRTPDIDPVTGGAAAKNMPNVADRDTPVVATVSARLVDGRADYGVHLFLLDLRSAAGLAEGVRVTELSQTDTPMPHARVTFDDVFVPEDALLGGRHCQIADGVIRMRGSKPEMFRVGVGDFTAGRSDLSTAALAMTRAALAGVVNYALQRRPDPNGPALIERGHVIDTLVTDIAAVYAATSMARRLRTVRAQGLAPAARARLAMLTKPLASNLAWQVLDRCQTLAGAQGHMRANRIPDWVGAARAIRTAEGANDLLQFAAGRHDTAQVWLPGTAGAWPGSVALAVRERGVSDAIAQSDWKRLDVKGFDGAAIARSEAAATRIAAACLAADRSLTLDPRGRELLTALLGEHTCAAIDKHGTWYQRNRDLTLAELDAFQDQRHAHREVLAEHLPTLVAAFAVKPLPGADIFKENYLKEG
ncbi:acyl-CoA dehydrogenase family protein [Nocardia puris]|uniref:acyl-CoA dehydrogenase family protein n=1 Tax=Nocardia puris TaxID=208602 RepID=UPI002E200A2E